ncbi:MAG: transpeptidase family protein [Lentimicrobiaceae bacterium]|nr:transpeptidase family protein [Lentimicrobiaceae bacterium]
MGDKREILKRIITIYIIVIAICLGIFAKVVYIQVAEGDYWEKIAKKQTFHQDTLFAVRGNIYSDDMQLLATTVPIFDISWDAKVVHDTVVQKYIDGLADSLASIFPEKTKSEYKKMLKDAKKIQKRDLKIRNKVNYDEYNRLKTFPIFCNGRNKGGLKADQRMQRKYPFNTLAYRTIGWDKEENKNDVGLEGTYSKYLQGKNGRRLVKRISKGISIPVNDEKKIDPQNGKDIISTLDVNIQDVAESALKNCLDTNNADWGCAILMEVATGHIKAITNLKHEKDGSYKETYNFAIGRRMDPGSTFKLISAIIVLEEGKYDTGTLVNTGRKIFDGKLVEDSHPEGYGMVSLKKAFEKSSNVGLAEAVVNTFGNNRRKINSYFDKLRVNKPLGLELSGEPNPNYIDPKNNLPRMAFGYGVEMTPLQILTFYNAVANNGKIVKPMFVTDIMQSGQVIEHKPTVVLKEKICSDATLKKIKIMLEGVVLHGTARRMKNNQYPIAGKTGTAKILEGGKYIQEYNASFVGYFPADNPRYSCIVLISRPKKTLKYGAELSAPVFREIADRVYATRLKGIARTNVKRVNTKASVPDSYAGKSKEIETLFSFLQYPLATNQNSSTWLVNEKGNVKNIVCKKGVVPDVQGLTAKDAVYLIEKAGLNVKLSGNGKVNNQIPAPGTVAIKGNIVTLTLGTITSTMRTVTTDSIPETSLTTTQKVKTIVKQPPSQPKKTEQKKNKTQAIKKKTEKKTIIKDTF